MLAFMAKSKLIQWGSLLQWQASFAGDGELEDVNLLILQAFFIWQIGNGYCLQSTGVWTFNLRNGDYSVPIGLGVGKVMKVGKVVFNLFAEPQFTVLAGRGGGNRNTKPLLVSIRSFDRASLYFPITVNVGLMRLSVNFATSSAEADFGR